MDDARLFRRVVCMLFPMIMLVALYRNVLGRDSTVDCSFDVILIPWIMASMFSKRMVNWSNPRQAVLQVCSAAVTSRIVANWLFMMNILYTSGEKDFYSLATAEVIKTITDGFTVIRVFSIHQNEPAYSKPLP
ncbi:BAK_1a_G0026660.mRNA.1.CDS.1 [Saccharomyces cerevisiae]|nr:BAK_1a_G0026660.mRNA.1.CDS.1 [Saccharomyces cerevisiae]CAI7091986.1 BAK_1a_G0026660.mRNA.1.CDS.1 [Saccharomyces cerevisiae]